MRPDPIALTRELIRFRTINPPGEEEACARHLGQLLEAAGFRCDYLAMGAGRANLVARIGGTSSGGRPPLAFTGHIDVVPLGATPWTFDPFAADTADGRVYGRGASDMKSGVAAFVAAAIEAAPRLASGPGLLLIITAGEETGCTGANHIVATARELLGRAGALVVAEPTSNRPMVGHKGALRLKLSARGVTAHASMPEQGVNAVIAAARAVARLGDFDFNVARHPVMGAPTLNVGWMHGGMNINSVPDLAEAGLDIRTIPTQRHADVEAQMRSFVGDEVLVSKLDEAVPVWTDPDMAWVRQVYAATRSVTGIEPAVATAPYFTDASALTPAFGGIPTVILGPGPAELAHQTDEWCALSAIEAAAEISARLIDDWQAGPV
ncbi:MAG: M20 family metallopeptidase [Hyphomicrobiaceae bacterium]|nr:M20 family metallopeptidase [Hyphomicrobiaceae bacterium]